MKVLTSERYEYILDKLNRENTVKIKDLEKEMNCSLSTVRRDLSELEDQNLLVRVHGGAKRVYTLASEMEVTEKSTKNIQEKKDIAKLAASFIQDEDIIYLDAGTTTYEMIPFLKEIKKLQVVTNGIKNADLLTDYGIATILIGGQIKATTKAIVGAVSLEQLSNYRFSKTFLGINGVDIEFGYTTPDPEEAALKSLAISLSNKTFVLADHTKFDKVNFVKVSALEDCVMITDKIGDKQKNKEKEYRKRTKIWEASK